MEKGRSRTGHSDNNDTRLGIEAFTTGKAADLMTLMPGKRASAAEIAEILGPQWVADSTCNDEVMNPGALWLRDRYMVFGMIAPTGTGAVFAAYDDGRREPVAVKYHFRGLLSASMRSAFKRETALLDRIRHPGIVRQYEYGETEKGDLFQVLQWAAEGSLIGWLQRLDKPPWFDRIATLISVAEGLAMVHKQGIVHGDIKPTNILLTDGGRACLGDWSSSFAEGEPQWEREIPHRGTFDYMARGSKLAKKPTRTVDLYAFATTLLQVLTGAPPRRLQEAENGRRTVMGALTRLHSHSEQTRTLLETLGDLLLRTLQPDRYDGFRNASELEEAMTEVVYRHRVSMQGEEPQS